MWGGKVKVKGRKVEGIGLTWRGKEVEGIGYRVKGKTVD